MSANRNARRKLEGRKLPAFGRELLELRRRGLVPADENGVERQILAALDSWQTWRDAPFRVVIAAEDDPAKLDWSFAAGLTVWISWHPAITPAERKDSAIAGILRANPREVYVLESRSAKAQIFELSEIHGPFRSEGNA